MLAAIVCSRLVVASSRASRYGSTHLRKSYESSHLMTKTVAYVLGTLVILSAAPAFACDCMPESESAARTRVDRIVRSTSIEVFRAKVVSTRNLPAGAVQPHGSRLVEATLRVEESVRGPARGSIVRVHFLQYEQGPDSCTDARPPLTTNESVTIIEDIAATVHWLFPEGCTADRDTVYEAVRARLVATPR